MMLGMATGENSSVCVQDFGIDNRTAADGLAVGRASGFVGGLDAPLYERLLHPAGRADVHPSGAAGRRRGSIP